MGEDRWREIMDLAKHKLVQWASKERVPLHDVLFQADFAEGDTGIDIWFFFEDEAKRVACQQSGQAREASNVLLKALQHFHYPFNRFPEVHFHLCSAETVRDQYKGSFYCRVRAGGERAATARVA